MTIEIANRLQKLRKEKGYSQEQLAEHLGISRQAVSKWERAEASPDTDNLIELAKLYNVSIDILLGLKDKTTEEKEETTINITNKGIDLVDKDEKVHIGLDGIKINDTTNKNTKIVTIKGIYMSIVSVTCILAYVLLGSLGSWWHPAWLVFLLMATLYTVFDAVVRKRVSDFGYPLLVVTVYLFLGFVFGFQQPSWVLFLTIPVFYIIAHVIDNVISAKKGDVKIVIDEEE